MKKIIIILALILILLSSLSISTQTDSVDTSQVIKENLIQQEKREPLNEIEKLKNDNYEKAMDAANRSIGLANMILALVAVILAVLGVFAYIKIGDISKKMKEEFVEIKNFKDQAKTTMEQVEEESRKIGHLKNEATVLMENIERTYERVINSDRFKYL